MKVRYLGHSCFLVSFKKSRVLIDPFFTDRCEKADFQREICCPAKKESIPRIDLILVTHEHFDHFDKDAIKFFAKRDGATISCAQTLINDLCMPDAGCQPLQMGQKAKLRGIEVEAMEAHHPQSFYPLAYLLKCDGQSVFHAGDTALTESFGKVKADVVMLPIGGTHTMDIIDAIRATKTMKPDYVIPMHYNTFGLIKADPEEFRQRIEKSVLKTKPLIMKPGQEVKI